MGKPNSDVSHFYGLGRISLKFFIGIPSGSEANRTEAAITQETTHGDIVRLPDLKESYTNLTLKTLSVIQWAHDSGFQHLIKVFFHLSVIILL